MCMTFDELVTHFGSLPLFDLSAIVQISGGDVTSMRTQLYRWRKSGKIIALRRGWYTLSDKYRKVVLYQTILANELYKPSYLSLLWALNYYGLIPERIVTYTSITSRVPRTFKNQFGTFEYFHVKQSNFFGFSSHAIQEQQVWLADSEKALLDFWYLNSGEWTIGRLSTYRFQNFDLVSCAKLQSYATHFNSPRIFRAVTNWKRIVDGKKEVDVEL